MAQAPPAYVDTLLVDCNRKGSEEYKHSKSKGNDNQAIFTCAQGSGIKLNPGDEVSLYSAFVNERGNTGNMEFKAERPSGSKGYTLKQTKLILSGYTEDVVAKGEVNNLNQGQQRKRHMGYGNPKALYYNTEFGGYKQASYYQEDVKFELSDNEANFQISYYKNTNGEGYLHLPRRFDCPDPATETNKDQYSASSLAFVGEAKRNVYGYPFNTFENAGDEYYWLYSCYDGNSLFPYIFENSATQARVDDDLGSGNGWDYPVIGSGGAITKKGFGSYNGVGVDYDNGMKGRCRTPLNVISQCKADIQKYDFGVKELAGGATSETTGQMYKMKNDNSRYTIYVKQNTYYDRAQAYNNSIKVGAGLDPLNLPEDAGTLNAAERFFNHLNKDPAVCCEWLRYYEIKNVKVKTGYNTPEEVAQQITDQLNETKAPKSIKASWGTTDLKQVSTSVEGECYKPFHAANHYQFGNTGFESWQEADTSDVPYQTHVDYQEAYQTIGVKRPEIWDAGRAIYYEWLLYPGDQKTSTGAEGHTDNRSYFTFHMGTTADSTLYNISKATGNAGTAIIVTTQFWNEKNVNRMNDLFVAQGRYPELFDYDENKIGTTKIRTTADNSRYLHVNIVLSDGDGAGTLSLGSDNYNRSTSWHDKLSHNSAVKGCESSYPIFFDYDPAQKDIPYQDNPPAEQLVYGTMLRIQTPGHTDTIGYRCQIKLGDYLFPGGGTGQPLTQLVSIGYDLHFTAYGTSAIMLHDGHLNANYDGRTLIADFAEGQQPELGAARPIYPWLKEVYLGANQIELGYDTGKFFLHQLHTPEYIGNDYAAGENQDNPIVSDADSQVYKVNKRLGATNFCPDMVPYKPATSTDQSGTTNNASIDIAEFNPNMTPWAINDAKSGIFIEDFGITEGDWGSSLWAMMGFSYGQMNIQGEYGRQTRLSNLETGGIGALTTNADVNTGDINSYVRNTFGAELLTSQIPGVNYALFETITGAYNKQLVPSLPAVSQTQESVRILADNLPIKMKNAYYLIKSDIITDTKYRGMGGNNQKGYETGQNLPIVAVVNKENGFGDYYFQDGFGQMAFTITKPTTLTSITTSIHDPDMSYARVDEGSCIIYKIKKNNTGNYNIGSMLMATQNVKK